MQGDFDPQLCQSMLVSSMCDPGGYKTDETMDIPANILRDVTSEEEIERQIMTRSMRYFQQTAMKEVVTIGPSMTGIQANHGLNSEMDDILADKFVIEQKVTEEMAEWLDMVKHTD